MNSFSKTDFKKGQKVRIKKDINAAVVGNNHGLSIENGDVTIVDGKAILKANQVLTFIEIVNEEIILEQNNRIKWVLAVGFLDNLELVG